MCLIVDNEKLLMIVENEKTETILIIINVKQQTS